MRIADDAAHLEDIFTIDGATNDRLFGELDLLPGIGRDELVNGIPHASVINASFCHASPEGGRFNRPDRGAWYAGFELKTSQAEVAFHKSRQYLEIGWEKEDNVAYDDYLANFDAEFHDIRGDRHFADCLDPGSYYASQGLAAELLAAGSLGIVYPSVRMPGGVCLACFRPALVGNVRQMKTWSFAWRGSAVPPAWLEQHVSG
ncbi:RES family NAD+ phosphorylase [Desulfolutivibrio sulfodismutans]|nr:RES family NAD+ phosphorylase [Desulfolutivibrio sulfodismutans]